MLSALIQRVFPMFKFNASQATNASGNYAELPAAQPRTTVPPTTSSSARPRSPSLDGLSARVTNASSEPKFKPLVDSIKITDENYVYLTHGTRAETYLNHIKSEGLDPARGGEMHGAAVYEGIPSSDARGRMKYGIDPNVALKYAIGPSGPEAAARGGAEIGVQLQARVRMSEFEAQMVHRAPIGTTEPYFQPETGGENHSPYLGNKEYENSMTPHLPLSNGTPVWSVETNRKIEPEDVRVIGVSLPAGATIERKSLKTEFGSASS